MEVRAPEKTWTWMDRSSWGSGPWGGEPDKVEWRDAATGLPCIVRRSPTSGAWCGYVGVPAGHPYYGKDYDSIEGLSVHGGLTYAAPCMEHEGEHAICHAPLPGESDRVWWLGYDCGHQYDEVPAPSRYGGWSPMNAFLDLSDEVCADEMPDGVEWGEYRTHDYAREQCRQLAAQLAAVTEAA